MENPSTASQGPLSGFSLWTWLALVGSLAGVVGSVLLSMALDLKACPLCFYERTFMMSVFAILLVGALDHRPGSLSLVALAPAVAGLSVAGFHVYLELNGTLECPRGLFELGTGPQQSLAIYVIVVLALAVDVLRNRRSVVVLLAAVVLGSILAVFSVKSAPPLPDAPKQPHTTPFDGCRRPFSPLATCHSPSPLVAGRADPEAARCQHPRKTKNRFSCTFVYLLGNFAR